MNQSSLFGNEPELIRRETKKHAKHDYPDIVRLEGPHQSSIDDATREELDLLEKHRPKTRGECHSAREKLGVTGCPYVSCRFNLLADVNDGLDVRQDVVELERRVLDGRNIKKDYTCVLDFVDAAHGVEGGEEIETESELDDIELTPVRELVSDETVGETMGLSGEWVRLTVKSALNKLRPAMARIDARLYKARR